MHKCVRCGRAATSLQEINDGCPCGSKAFVFNREAVNGESIAGEEVAPKGGKIEAEGKVPESYSARMTFTSEDVENIKVLTEGVFVLSLHSLSRDPVVLKDEEGIYYVKIPFEQNGDGKAGGKKGKKK